MLHTLAIILLVTWLSGVATPHTFVKKAIVAIPR